MAVTTIMQYDLTQDRTKKTRSQDIIPIRQICENGMFKHDGGRWSMTYDLKDIDYNSAGNDDRKKVYDSWKELLNSLDNSKAVMKITLLNRRMNKKDRLQQTLLPTDIGDGYDHIRTANNRLRYDDIQGDRGFIQDKFITFSTEKKNQEKAESYFNRMERDLSVRVSTGVEKCCTHFFTQGGNRNTALRGIKKREAKLIRENLLTGWRRICSGHMQTISR